MSKFYHHYFNMLNRVGGDGLCCHICDPGIKILSFTIKSEVNGSFPAFVKAFQALKETSSGLASCYDG